MGYKLNPINDFGRVDAILYNNDGTMTGFSDRRGSGKTIGY